MEKVEVPDIFVNWLDFKIKEILCSNRSGSSEFPNSVTLVDEIDAINMAYVKDSADADRAEMWIKFNYRTAINAIINGYETVYSKYNVIYVGLADDNNVLNYDTDTSEFYVDDYCATDGIETEFSEDWLYKNFPKFGVMRANGIIELREVQPC